MAFLGITKSSETQIVRDMCACCKYGKKLSNRNGHSNAVYCKLLKHAVDNFDRCSSFKGSRSLKKQLIKKVMKS